MMKTTEKEGGLSMKMKSQKGSVQGIFRFPIFMGAIVAMALFSLADIGHGKEMSVDDRVKALEDRLDKVDKQVQEADITD
jgi:hypothetical protein